MSLSNILRKWKNRNQPIPREITYEEKQRILMGFDRTALIRALKNNVEIPQDEKDYVMFIAEDKHLARFHNGKIKMGCRVKPPQEWIDQADEQAEDQKYTLRQKEKYIMFFEMCLKLQGIEEEVEEFRKKKLEEKK